MDNLRDKRILVTGASGFVGGYLLTALEDIAGAEVHSAAVAITDAAAVDERVASVQPQVVFHLAAQAHVPTSFSDPDGTWAVNLHGTLNLLRSVARHCPGATFINVGSSDMYGASFRSGAAVDENTPLLPLNPYAASKAAADLAAFQQAAVSDLRVIRARSFNHSGPGQKEGYVLPAFAAQVARIEAGLQAPVVQVGDLSAERDFLHVADVVDAYLRLADRAPELAPGSVFNIASGSSQRLDALLQGLLARSRVAIAVETDPARLRPVDIRRVCARPEALQQATGWQSTHSIDDLLDALLTDWRERVTA